MSQGPAASFDTGRHLRYSQRLEAALREVLLPPPQQPPPGTGAQEPEATLALGAEAGTGEGAEAEAEWGASSSGVGLLVVRAQELDDPRFDAEEAVNRRFPDPASLDRLEEFVGTLEDMVGGGDTHIHTHTHTHTPPLHPPLCTCPCTHTDV